MCSDSPCRCQSTVGWRCRGFGTPGKRKSSVSCIGHCVRVGGGGREKRVSVKWTACCVEIVSQFLLMRNREIDNICQICALLVVRWAHPAAAGERSSGLWWRRHRRQGWKCRDRSSRAKSRHSPGCCSHQFHHLDLKLTETAKSVPLLSSCCSRSCPAWVLLLLKLCHWCCSGDVTK